MPLRPGSNGAHYGAGRLPASWRSTFVDARFSVPGGGPSEVYGLKTRTQSCASLLRRWMDHSP